MRQKSAVALAWLLMIWILSGTSSLLAAAGPAHLIKDIETAPLIDDGRPSDLVNVSDTTYFVAHDRFTGYGLWRTDSTGAGTVKVKDLYLAQQLTRVGSAIFFVSGELQHGWEIWKSDGTAAGTEMVKDINPSADLNNRGSIAIALAALNGNIMFLVDDGVHGRELWRSDGTQAGTTLVKDIHPGPIGSTLDYGQGVVFENRLYFSYCESTCLIWQSDGTEAGTIPWIPPDESLIPNGVQLAGDRLLFSAYVGSPNWSFGITDGTLAGTHHLFDGRNFYFLGEVNGLLLFAGDDGVHGSELWRSDGTQAGTTLVKDIHPGPGSSLFFYTAMTAGGRLFFAADDGLNGYELWRSDGTEGGTVLVKDILPGPSSSEPTPIAVVGGILLFSANDGDHGSELWRSDGTEAGTAMIKDANPGFAGSVGIASPLEPVHGAVILPMDDFAHGMELWRSDGTSAGTMLVKDIAPFVGTWGSDPNGLTSLGDSIVMDLNSPGFFGPGTVWRSDGTEEGTFRLGDFTANLAAASTPAGGFDYFFGYDPAHGSELWRTDGTAAGTHLVKDACAGPASCSSQRGIAVNDRFFYPSADEHGLEPWISDGSEAGTYLVKDILPGSPSSRPLPLGAAGGLAFFSAPAVPGGTSLLWTSNGTEAGTNPVGSNPVRTNFRNDNHAMSGGKLFFIGSDATHGSELWKSDGSVAGTILVKDLTPGIGGSITEQFTDMTGTLFFFRDLPFTDRPGQTTDLWKSDGTEAGTVWVRDLGSVQVDEVIAVGSLLFFTTRRLAGDYGVDLWRSDGSTAGTRMLRQDEIIVATTAFSMPSLGAVDGVLLFAADDGVNGCELWRSDGTEQGTFIVQDIAPGEEWSIPQGFVTAGGRVFFAADDVVHGRELWGGRAAVVTVQPRQAILDLAGDLHAIGLPQGIETSLGAKLDAAAKDLERGAQRAAAGSLGAFSRELEAQSGKSVAARNADDLLEFTEEILGLLDDPRIQAARSVKPSASRPHASTPIGKTQQPHRGTRR